MLRGLKVLVQVAAASGAFSCFSLALLTMLTVGQAEAFAQPPPPGGDDEFCKMYCVGACTIGNQCNDPLSKCQAKCDRCELYQMTTRCRFGTQ